jgi:hypothetical protein
MYGAVIGNFLINTIDLMREPQRRRALNNPFWGRQIHISAIDRKKYDEMVDAIKTFHNELYRSIMNVPMGEKHE